MIILTYVDDYIIVELSMKNIEVFVKLVKDKSKTFVLTDKGDMNKFLGIEIKELNKKLFKISQPFLIKRISSFLQPDQNSYTIQANSKVTPVGKITST